MFKYIITTDISLQVVTYQKRSKCLQTAFIQRQLAFISKVHRCQLILIALIFFFRLMFTLVYSPRSQGCVRSALPCTEINCRDAVSYRVRTTGTDVSHKELGTSHKDADLLFISIIKVCYYSFTGNEVELIC